ncbi:MAG: hypothetical protein K6A36_06130 [Paludibacteraceae bacterium]|nr:hypothetical protein [Paludibacteraceae bacterium]
MKRNWIILSVLVFMLASCGGSSQKACYEIILTVNEQSESIYVYADENEADAAANQMKENYILRGFPEDKLSLRIQKHKKAESDCKAEEKTEEKPEPEIKRTVKPTATFEMKVTGINPSGYPQYRGAELVCDLPASCRIVEAGNGHSSTPLMILRRLSGGFSYKYDDITWKEYVLDNSYVGGRIICLDANSNSSTISERLTEDDKELLASFIESYFDGTPDGPFQLKKTCTWNFRLGRDSSYTYVDEVVETFANAKAFEEAILNYSSENPIFQSLFFYDAKKDEFILQDRKSWNLK